MKWLARLFRMESPEVEEEEAENPTSSQGRLLPFKVVRNKRPAIWAIAYHGNWKTQSEQPIS
jgi:hypothetical protein